VNREWTAQSRTELLDRLANQDITGPLRRCGRTREDCERWAAFRLLATWATSDRFSCPLCITHDDRPDFRLSANCRTTGIECTTATSQEWEATDAKMEKEGKEARNFFIDAFARGTPTRSKREREELIRNPPPPGAGWGDNGMDQEWASSIMDSIRKKTDDFLKPDFGKYDENLLLIYDNLPVFRLPRPEPIQYLIRELESYFTRSIRYDGVIVDSGGELLEFRPACHVQPVIDLWEQKAEDDAISVQ
jgi:hypothetical protein